MVVAEARRYGIKLIGEFAGDANGTEPYGPPQPGGIVGNQSSDWYCAWHQLSQADCPTATFEDPRLLADYERHMRAVLNHVNHRTGLAYKNDPTFAGWVDGNNLWLLNKTPLPKFQAWLNSVSRAFKTVDHRQLFIDISLAGGDYLPPADTFGLGPSLGPTPPSSVLDLPDVDVYGQEWYPKDFPALDQNSGAATEIHVNAKAIAAAHKVYTTIEYGWDHDNYSSRPVFRSFLAGLGRDPNIAGELFWELAAHDAGHGWQAIPANEHCTPTCNGLVEDGSWWAMYYTGRTTASNSAADMAARAQLIRTASYGLDGFRRVPGHERSPAPTITSTRGGLVLFQGSAGAARYSIQRLSGTRWTIPCDRCATDATGSWQDPRHRAGCYRAIAENLADRPSAPSAPAGNCRRAAADAGAARTAAPHWVGSWSSSPVRPGLLSGTAPAFSGTGGLTVRDVVHLTLGGTKLRVRLSNVFGSRTATFTDVHVALRSRGAATVPGTDRRLRFSGRTRVAVAVGHQITSDTVALPVRAGDDLTISLYAAAPTGNVTVEGSLNHLNYLSGSGDVAGSAAAASFPVQSSSWYWLGAVDVLPHSADAGAVVALGDSITAGYDSTQNANRGWADLLVSRLHTAFARPQLSVLNAGIAGNNLHEDTACFGQSALHRLNRDALDQTGVRDVIVDEGANDLSHPIEPPSNALYPCVAHQKISAAGMIALFKQAIRRIHARHLRAIGVTISPFGRYQYWTPAIEAERQTINHWIRTTHAFDGYIDFDRALRAPAPHVAWLKPAFDSGDHLHPNNAGHAAMVRAIPVRLFRP